MIPQLCLTLTCKMPGTWGSQAPLLGLLSDLVGHKRLFPAKSSLQRHSGQSAIPLHLCDGQAILLSREPAPGLDRLRSSFCHSWCQKCWPKTCMHLSSTCMQAVENGDVDLVGQAWQQVHTGAVHPDIDTLNTLLK